jgi:wobble nucleotide-excising tRNase
MNEIPIAAIDQIVRQQERIADLERKLAKCREALDGLMDAIQSVQDWNETYVGEKLDAARETLEQTK